MLASTATFHPLFRIRLKHDSPVSLGSTPDNRPSEASGGLAPVPGPRLYNRSDCTEGAMFGICQKSQRWHCGGYAMRDSISWVGCARWFEWDHTGFPNEGRFAGFRLVSPKDAWGNLWKLSYDLDDRDRVHFWPDIRKYKQDLSFLLSGNYLLHASPDEPVNFLSVCPRRGPRQPNGNRLG